MRRRRSDREVIGERQLATLRDLGSRLAAASTRAEVMASLEVCLAGEPRDLPFAVAYFVEARGKEAALAAAHGLEQTVRRLRRSSRSMAATLMAA